MWAATRVQLARWKSFDFIKGRSKCRGAVHTRHTHGSKGRYKRLSTMYGIRDGRRHTDNRLSGALGLKLGGGLFGLRVPRQHALSTMTRDDFDLEVYGHPNITNPYRDFLWEHPQLREVMQNARMELKLVVVMPRISWHERQSPLSVSSASVASALPSSWELLIDHLLDALLGKDVPPARRQRRSRASAATSTERVSSLPLEAWHGGSSITLATTGASFTISLAQLLEHPAKEVTPSTSPRYGLRGEAKRALCLGALKLYEDYLRGEKIGGHETSGKRKKSPSPTVLFALDVASACSSRHTSSTAFSTVARPERLGLREQSFLAAPRLVSSPPSPPPLATSEQTLRQSGFPVIVREMRLGAPAALCFTVRLELAPRCLAEHPSSAQGAPVAEGMSKPFSCDAPYLGLPDLQIADQQVKQARLSHRLVRLLSSNGHARGNSPGSHSGRNHAVHDLVRWLYANNDPRAHFCDALGHSRRCVPVHLFVDGSQLAASAPRGRLAQSSKDSGSMPCEGKNSTESLLAAALSRQHSWFPSHDVPSLVGAALYEELRSLGFHQVNENVEEAIASLSRWHVDCTWRDMQDRSRESKVSAERRRGAGRRRSPVRSRTAVVTEAEQS